MGLRARQQPPRFDVGLFVPPKKLRRVIGRIVRQRGEQCRSVGARFLWTKGSVQWIYNNRKGWPKTVVADDVDNDANG